MRKTTSLEREKGMMKERGWGGRILSVVCAVIATAVPILPRQFLYECSPTQRILCTVVVGQALTGRLQKGNLAE